MENLNKLSYTQYKVNEKLLYIPMEDIRQEYDDKKFAIKPYLFRVLYIDKYNKKTNEYSVYLGPRKKSSLPIIKASIPLELLRTNRLIPGYNYDRPLEDNELFIINERVFRKVDENNKYCFNNKKYGKYYILCYGYFINQYKDDDALTKKTEGIQQFRLITDCPKKVRDRGYETPCYVTNRLSKIFDLKIQPGYKLPNLQEFREFKELPEGFFIDKK